jgi:hypothetical protein
MLEQNKIVVKPVDEDRLVNPANHIQNFNNALKHIDLEMKEQIRILNRLSKVNDAIRSIHQYQKESQN